ncbi:hypothetical protein RRG08_014896 [Elysia crispata]|uniref:Uncharacterized protein n=1 Tax=Elysia crispata TaxID=231223 RepID=A0AAE0ZMJ9_9GAST|nr:hypothetical protein RRG08_014896 [Elysia crispata]
MAGMELHEKASPLTLSLSRETATHYLITTFQSHCLTGVTATIQSHYLTRVSATQCHKPTIKSHCLTRSNRHSVSHPHDLVTLSQCKARNESIWNWKLFMNSCGSILLVSTDDENCESIISVKAVLDRPLTWQSSNRCRDACRQTICGMRIVDLRFFADHMRGRSVNKKNISP